MKCIGVIQLEHEKNELKLNQNEDELISVEGRENKWPSLTGRL